MRRIYVGNSIDGWKRPSAEFLKELLSEILLMPSVSLLKLIRQYANAGQPVEDVRLIFIDPFNPNLDQFVMAGQ